MLVSALCAALSSLPAETAPSPALIPSGVIEHRWQSPAFLWSAPGVSAWRAEAGGLVRVTRLDPTRTPRLWRSDDPYGVLASEIPLTWDDAGLGYAPAVWPPTQLLLLTWDGNGPCPAQVTCLHSEPQSLRLLHTGLQWMQQLAQGQTPDRPSCALPPCFHEALQAAAQGKTQAAAWHLGLQLTQELDPNDNELWLDRPVQWLHQGETLRLGPDHQAQLYHRLEGSLGMRVEGPGLLELQVRRRHHLQDATETWWQAQLRCGTISTLLTLRSVPEDLLLDADETPLSRPSRVHLAIPEGTWDFTLTSNDSALVGARLRQPWFTAWGEPRWAALVGSTQAADAQPFLFHDDSIADPSALWSTTTKAWEEPWVRARQQAHQLWFWHSAWSSALPAVLPEDQALRSWWPSASLSRQKARLLRSGRYPQLFAQGLGWPLPLPAQLPSTQSMPLSGAELAALPFREAERPTWLPHSRLRLFRKAQWLLPGPFGNTWAELRIHLEHDALPLQRWQVSFDDRPALEIRVDTRRLPTRVPIATDGPLLWPLTVGFPLPAAVQKVSLDAGHQAQASAALVYRRSQPAPLSLRQAEPPPLPAISWNADAYGSGHNAAEALRRYSQQIHLGQHTSTEARLQRAQLLEHLGADQRAALDLRNILEEHPDHPQALLALAWLSGGWEGSAQSAALLERVDALGLKGPQCDRLRAAQALRRGDHQRVQLLLEPWATDERWGPSAQLGLALAAALSGDWPTADTYAAFAAQHLGVNDRDWQRAQEHAIATALCSQPGESGRALAQARLAQALERSRDVARYSQARLVWCARWKEHLEQLQRQDPLPWTLAVDAEALPGNQEPLWLSHGPRQLVQLRNNDGRGQHNLIRLGADPARFQVTGPARLRATFRSDTPETATLATVSGLPGNGETVLIPAQAADPTWYVVEHPDRGLSDAEHHSWDLPPGEHQITIVGPSSLLLGVQVDNPRLLATVAQAPAWSAVPHPARRWIAQHAQLLNSANSQQLLLALSDLQALCLQHPEQRDAAWLRDQIARRCQIQMVEAVEGPVLQVPGLIQDEAAPEPAAAWKSSDFRRYLLPQADADTQFLDDGQELRWRWQQEQPADLFLEWQAQARQSPGDLRTLRLSLRRDGTAESILDIPLNQGQGRVALGRVLPGTAALNMRSLNAGRRVDCAVRLLWERNGSYVPISNQRTIRPFQLLPGEALEVSVAGPTRFLLWTRCLGTQQDSAALEVRNRDEVLLSETLPVLAPAQGTLRRGGEQLPLSTAWLSILPLPAGPAQTLSISNTGKTPLAMEMGVDQLDQPSPALEPWQAPPQEAPLVWQAIPAQVMEQPAFQQRGLGTLWASYLGERHDVSDPIGDSSFQDWDGLRLGWWWRGRQGVHIETWVQGRQFPQFEAQGTDLHVGITLSLWKKAALDTDLNIWGQAQPFRAQSDEQRLQVRQWWDVSDRLRVDLRGQLGQWSSNIEDRAALPFAYQDRLIHEVWNRYRDEHRRWLRLGLGASYQLARDLELQGQVSCTTNEDLRLNNLDRLNGELQLRGWWNGGWWSFEHHVVQRLEDDQRALASWEWIPRVALGLDTRWGGGLYQPSLAVEHLSRQSGWSFFLTLRLLWCSERGLPFQDAPPATPGILDRSEVWREP